MINIDTIKTKSKTPSFITTLKSDLVPVIGLEQVPSIAKNYAVTKFTVYEDVEALPPYTPTALIKEITDKLIGSVDFSTAKFLVIYTVEWANYLQSIHGVPAENITVVGDSKRFEVSIYQGYNFITADNFLAEDFNKEDELKFDVVIGNPPYQKNTNVDKDINNKQGSFWFDFVKISLRVLKHGGNLIMVTPKSVFGAGHFKSDSFKVRQLVEKNSFTYIWPCLNHHFSVGIEILGFGIKKGIAGLQTEIVGTGEEILIDGSFPVPLNLSSLSFSIVKKCFNVGDTTIGFREKIVADDDSLVLKVNGGRFKIWSKTFVGFNKDTEHNQQGAIIHPDHLLGYKSAVKSKLWGFLFKVLGGEQGNSVTGMVDRLPTMPDMSIEYTDAEWYDAFCLNQEEIDFIEAMEI